jgi:hydroxyacylglutathione hydrolase
MKNWETKKGSRVYRVLSGRSNAYLISTRAGDCLVDTGATTSCEKLARNVRRCGGTAPAPDLLILTHTHFDHCRSAKSVQEKYGCRIAVSALAAGSAANGYTRIPGGTGLFTNLLSEIGRAIGGSMLGYPPFHPDILLEDKAEGSFLDGHIRILPTPGHSADSLSILLDEEIALVGDAMVGVFPNSIFVPFADDIPEVIRSWKKLLDTGCSTFLPGHGWEVGRDLLKKEYISYALRYQPVI